jgi:hypothetical protein
MARDIWAFIWIHCFPFSNSSFSHFHIPPHSVLKLFDGFPTAAFIV